MQYGEKTAFGVAHLDRCDLGVEHHTSRMPGVWTYTITNNNATDNNYYKINNIYRFVKWESFMMMYNKIFCANYEK